MDYISFLWWLENATKKEKSKTIWPEIKKVKP